MTSPTGKVTTAAEAVADIEDGASVGIAGFGLSHLYPSTLISALGEKGSRGLTVYCNGLGQPGFPTGHLLADNHQIAHLVTCFSARPGVVSEAEKQIMAGEMTLEMVPQGTLVERMRAGGAGSPPSTRRPGTGPRSPTARTSGTSTAGRTCSNGRSPRTSR